MPLFLFVSLAPFNDRDFVSFYMTKSKRAAAKRANAVDMDFIVARLEVVQRVDPAIVKALKNDYLMRERERLFTLCADAYLLNVGGTKRLKIYDRLQNFEIHHILPHSLGGTNDFSNVVLSRPDFHVAIHQMMHRYLNRQRHLPFGAAYLVPIPRHPEGLKVWSFRRTALRLIETPMAA